MTQRQCVYELFHWHNTQLICVKCIKNSWMTISSVRISYPAECNCHLLLWKTSESFSCLLLSIQTTVYQTVNTVCLGFSYEFIEFSQSWFYRWFLAKIMDFGGKDEGFLAKITDFWRRLRIFWWRLRIFWRRLRISLSSPMFTVHTNEWGTCTCLHWACADILMRNPLYWACADAPLGMCRRANEGKSNDWLNSINS